MQTRVRQVLWLLLVVVFAVALVVLPVVVAVVGAVVLLAGCWLEWVLVLVEVEVG